MLRDQLPSKEEHVMLVRLSPIQRALYTEFMNRFREAGNSGWLGLNPLKAFCVCCKVGLFLFALALFLYEKHGWVRAVQASLVKGEIRCEMDLGHV